MKTGKLGLKDRLYVLLWELKVWFKPQNIGPKVFCIGFNKTGTTALGQSLKMLGYDHSSFNRKLWRKHYKNGNISAILRYTAKFESFDDLPWLKEDLIPILDEKFPGSKFIYLQRSEEDWKQSLKNWKSTISTDIVDTNKAYQDYRKHKEFVDTYFENRNDIIRLEIKDPEGFDKLAAFLGKKSPQPNFPRFNAS